MPDTKWINRDEALELAKDFLKKQTWGNDCDEQSARVIESNECINILFRFKTQTRPAETIISVEKIGGKVEWVKLG